MQTRLSASIRFIYAVLRLSADIAEGFGKVVVDILSRQYPEMKKEMAADPRYAENAAASIGNKLLAVARKQLQYNDQDAYDAIQDFLTYLYTSKFDFKAKSKKGKEGAKTWRAALDNIYANMRNRSMSHSFKKFKSGKHTDEELYADMLWRRNQVINGNQRYSWSDEDDDEMEKLGKELLKKKVDLKSIVPTKLRRKNVRDKTIDEAFGKRGEEGGSPEGGIGRVPQSTDTTEGLPVDDKAAKKNFLETLDQLVPDLKNSLPLSADKLPAQKLLFDFIFEEDGSGTFLPDINANMGQASDFRNYLEEMSQGSGPQAEEAQAILKRYGKRWSGFVGDTRRDLMKSIQNFVEEYLPEDEYDKLWNEFFSDATPQSAEKTQLKGKAKQMEYQRGLDLRKILRETERDKLGLLSEKDKQQLVKLKKRVQSDIDEEYKEGLSEWNKYMDRMMEYSDLPPEKQPKFKRPVKPKKPMSLDEQLKATAIEYGEEARKLAEKEAVAEPKDKKNLGDQEDFEDRGASTLRGFASLRDGVDLFFQRFLTGF